jgi:disulfide bond formation protein DsbB
VLANTNGRRAATPRPCAEDVAWNLVFVCWLVATTSTLAALFFSEVMSLPPCVLCWYQRIFIFPLVLLLPAGLFPWDPKIVRYALPLALVGWSIALFHVLITAGLIPEGITPCTQGVPCAQNQIEWFGFLSIPLLSLAAFSVISALLLLTHYKVAK